MLVAERQDRIRKLITERGSMRVSELSRIFEVTEETIRRDLEKLESEGAIRRSHGGAVSTKHQNTREISFSEREIMNIEDKKEVARKALQFIKQNDRIILDASSTAWYLAEMLPDIPLTIITNSMKVAFELSGKEHMTVISTGGIVSQKSFSFVGPIVNRTLELYHVNKAFISCDGIDKEWGISDSNEKQALVKKKMIEISDQVFLLADHSKFGIKSFSNICSLDSIDYVISDSRTEVSQIQKIKDVSSIDIIRAGTS